MSEIQAIATNNYILHNIGAKKLYVQEPLFTANSGDAVYVGWRPDETVLFSGNAVNDDVINLSENWNNFEYIGLEVYDIYGWGYNRTLCPTNMVSVAGNRAKRFQAGYGFVDNNNNQIYQRFFELYFPNGEYKTCSGYGRGIQISTAGAVSTNTDVAIKLNKVVGINRKENA